jgi:hypothetical protein
MNGMTDIRRKRTGGTYTDSNSNDLRFSIAPNDGLERKNNSFNPLGGGVRTMWAPGNQSKSKDNQGEGLC